MKIASNAWSEVDWTVFLAVFGRVFLNHDEYSDEVFETNHYDVNDHSLESMVKVVEAVVLVLVDEFHLEEVWTIEFSKLVQEIQKTSMRIDSNMSRVHQPVLEVVVDDKWHLNKTKSMKIRIKKVIADRDFSMQNRQSLDVVNFHLIQ